MNKNKLKQEQEIFEQYSVPRAVAVMVIPAVISQIVHVVYNLADTWFVGFTENPDAVAAISVCMPLYLTMTGLSNLFGIGGASIIGRSLGKKDVEKAQKAFSSSFWCSVLIASAYSLLILVINKNLLRMIGGNDRNIDYAISYMRITIGVGGIPTILSAVLSHLIRATGRSRVASFGMTVGAILNIILDPLFMFVLLPKGHEVEGAAIATTVANIIPFLFFIIYIFRCIVKNKNDESICVKFYHKHEVKELVVEEARCGAPSFLIIVMAMLSNCVLNPMVTSTGNQAMAGLGITRKVDSLAHGVNQGVTQGMLPLAAFCYGAGKKERMRHVVLLSATLTGIFSLLSTILSCVFAPSIIGLFINDPETIVAGAFFIRVLSLAIPIYSITFVIIAVFQAMGRTAESFLLSVLHKGTIDIVAMFIIFYKWGGKYTPWGNVISEIITLVVALVVLRRNWQDLFQESR